MVQDTPDNPTSPAASTASDTGGDTGGAAGRKSRVPLGLVVLIGLCVVIELYLQGSDRGFWSTVRMRMTAYDYAGFLPGLLYHWTPNYAVQPYTMFVSYAFLHGGLVHLLFNMVTLWSLGKLVYARVGARGFWILYVTSILGGGALFGLLANSTQVMVGASGALFGLFGGLLAWNYVDRFTEQERLWPIARAVLILVAMNVVLWWAMGGQLAWQTHLGGFMTGWAAALVIDPTSKPEFMYQDDGE